MTRLAYNRLLKFAYILSQAKFYNRIILYSDAFYNIWYCVMARLPRSGKIECWFRWHKTVWSIRRKSKFDFKLSWKVGTNQSVRKISYLCDKYGFANATACLSFELTWDQIYPHYTFINVKHLECVCTTIRKYLHFRIIV